MRNEQTVCVPAIRLEVEHLAMQLRMNSPERETEWDTGENACADYEYAIARAKFERGNARRTKGNVRRNHRVIQAHVAILEVVHQS